MATEKTTLPIKMDGIIFKADEFGEFEFSIKVDLFIETLHKLRNNRNFIDGKIKLASKITEKGITHHAFADLETRSSFEKKTSEENGESNL